MKKILLLLVIFVSVFMVSCGKKSADDGPVVLEFWTHEDPNRDAIESRYVKEFMEANPDITINRTTQASNKIFELVLTAFAANSGPDIFNMQIEQAYSYITNGRVAPVDYKAAGFDSADDMRSQYIEGSLDAVDVDGKIYGIPLELNNWAIYVNKRVFADAGLDAEKDYPKTWEEMADVSEKLIKRNGEIITRRGFDFRYPYYLISMIPMVNQLGGKLISDDGKTAIVGDDAWIKFLTYMGEWGPNGRNLGSPTYKNARKIFNLANDDIAMCLSGLYQEARIKSDNPEFYESGDWMIVPFPVFENAVNNVASNYYGQFYMVNGQSSERKIKAAWRFLGYMMSHSEEYLKAVNIIPPTKELMASETFNSMPYSEVFVDDLARAQPVYTAENGAKMEELVKEAVESVMLSGMSPKDAHATLKRKAQELVDEG